MRRPSRVRLRTASTVARVGERNRGERGDRSLGDGRPNVERGVVARRGRSVGDEMDDVGSREVGVGDAEAVAVEDGQRTVEDGQRSRKRHRAAGSPVDEVGRDERLDDAWLAVHVE
jgi:hypothetical protein